MLMVMDDGPEEDVWGGGVLQCRQTKVNTGPVLGQGKDESTTIAAPRILPSGFSSIEGGGVGFLLVHLL